MTGSVQPPFVPAQWYPPDPPKSAVAASLLELFFGWFGLGRFYVGSVGIALTQLVLGILGICTVFLFVGFFILVPLSIWTFIDAILMFSGSMKDRDGRKLR
jgi:TM2 domain-containing membrane protein YozV